MGAPLPRALPVTGPADVHRRLVACGAADGGRFAARAAAAWGEWPIPLGGSRAVWTRAASEAQRAGAGWAVGHDRVLWSGEGERLRSLGTTLARCGDTDLSAIGRWLAAGGAMHVGAAVPGAPPPLECGAYRLAFGHKTYVVGIVNRAIGSFSDGCQDLPSVARTVDAAWAAWRGGADIVDIGAESSAERDQGGLDPGEEIGRLVPVLEALLDLPALLAVDTRHGAVAAAALRVVPVFLNDVDALADPALAEVAAVHRAPVVLMDGGSSCDNGADVVDGIVAFLGEALCRADAAGVAREQVVLDAGFGFGKSVGEDLQATRRLGELRRLGRPLLHAPSRKHAIGRVLGFPESIPERLPGTAAAVSIGIAAGADLVRVHDLPWIARVARATDAFVGRPSWDAITAV